MAYFTDDSLLPENMAPLMITAAPYGPMWMPQDGPPGYIPLTWDEQVQAAVDCYNAGATLLHIHVRDPKTGHISKNFKEYGEQIGRVREAVPKMILQVGGSISFAPEPGEVGAFGTYEQRHKLTTIDPKPDQITVTCGTSLFDLTALHPMAEFEGTRLCNEDAMHGISNMVADSTPDFYVEETRLCVEHGIQPYFALRAHPLARTRGAHGSPRRVHGADERLLQHRWRRYLRRKPVRFDGTRAQDAARLVLHVSNDVSFDASRSR